MVMKIVKVIAAFLVILIPLISCVGCKNEQLDEIAQIKRRNELIVYTNATFPPYEFVGQNKEIVGVDIEIAKAVATKMGVTLKVKNTEFNSIIASIKTGKGDFGIGAITMNDDRKQVVDFSIPYDVSNQYLVIKEDSDIKYLEDLQNKKVGAEIGSIGYIMMEDSINHGDLKDKGVKAKPYNSSADAMLGLTKNKIDAIVVDEPVSQELVERIDGYKAIPLVDKRQNEYKGEFGVVFKKGDLNLESVVNEVLDDLLRQDKIEEYKRYYNELVSENN